MQEEPSPVKMKPIVQAESSDMSETGEQTLNKDETWVNANWISLIIKGAALADTEEAAKNLAEAAGAELWRYDKPGAQKLFVNPEGERRWETREHEACYDNPQCILECDSEGTELLFQLSGGAESLEKELEAAAAFTARAWESTPEPAPVEMLEIVVAMGANRPPPEMPDEPEKPLTETIGTPGGTYMQHSTWWEKCDDISEDSGSPYYDVTARSITGGPALPDEEELTNVLKATYTHTAMRFLGMEIQ